MKAFFGIVLSAMNGVFKLAAGTVGLIGFGFLLVVIYFIGKLFFTVSSLDDNSGLSAQKEALQKTTSTQKKVNSVTPVLSQPQSDSDEIPAMLNSKSVNNLNTKNISQAPSDVMEFKEVVCRKGTRIVYEDDTIIQCRKIDSLFRATLNYDKSGYRDITLTLDLKNKYMISKNKSDAAIVMDDYVEELKKSLTVLGKKPEIAEHFRTLPLSSNWNKATVIDGVEFNIPDKGGVERYGNYMLTITK